MTQLNSLQTKIVETEFTNFYEKLDKRYKIAIKTDVQTSADLINLEYWCDYIRERPIRLWESMQKGSITFEQFIEWMREKSQSKAWRLWRLNQKEKQTKSEIDLLKWYEEECWRTLALDYLVSNEPTPLEVVNAKYERKIIKEKWIDLDCLIDYELTTYETKIDKRKAYDLRKKAQHIWRELQ